MLFLFTGALRSRVRTDTNAQQPQLTPPRPASPFRTPWGMILLFIGPVMLYYGIFIIYPILATFYNAFHTISPQMGKMVTTFVGFANFRQLFDDRIFKLAVSNTLTWGLVGPTIEMITATALAFILFFKVPFHRFYRAAWFAPMLIVGVIAGMIFKWIFNYDWGLVNVGLRAIGLDQLALNWLGRRDTPLWVAIFVHFWNTFGFSFILILAGLTGVDKEVIESAYIDGASRWQVCRSILFPLLLPVFKTVLILSFMGKMRAFHIVWVLTHGGPMHFSETVATYVQKRAFGWSTVDLGYPSAIAVFWFGIVIVSVILIDRWLKTRIERYGL
jgi:raffinose/stachyose/melibiose transport system permease protein